MARQYGNRGNIRENFFANQVGYLHKLNYADQGDFMVDGQYTFEVGGKDKTSKQIKNLNNGYIVADDITHEFQNKIPLWLFGFLY